MFTRNFFLVASLFFLSGCSLLEGLSGGLGTLARYAEGQPDIYVASEVFFEGIDVVRIDRVTVVRGRPGAPTDVLYEGWRRDFKQLYLFPGEIVSLSLRSDAARIVAVHKGDIGDGTETSLLLYTAPEGRTLLEIIDYDLHYLIFETCFDSTLFQDDLDEYLRDEGYIDPDQPYDVRWDIVNWDRRDSSGSEDWDVEFLGWTAAGNIVVSANIGIEAFVTQDNPVFSRSFRLYEDFDSFARYSDTVIISGNTGEPVSCYGLVPLVPQGATIFDVNTERVSASDGLSIDPRNGGTFTLYNYPSGEPPQRLLFLGGVDAIAVPERN